MANPCFAFARRILLVSDNAKAITPINIRNEPDSFSTISSTRFSPPKPKIFGNQILAIPIMGKVVTTLTLLKALTIDILPIVRALV